MTAPASGDEPPQLSLSSTRTPGRVTVGVSGEVDACTCGRLRQHLIDVIDAQGDLPVDLDLGNMTFIDSSGLSVLVEMHLRAQDQGGTFVLHNPRPSAAKIFEIVGLNSVLTIR
jgi:anti-sigma B factor antagonist